MLLALSERWLAIETNKQRKEKEGFFSTWKVEDACVSEAEEEDPLGLVFVRREALPLLVECVKEE